MRVEAINSFARVLNPQEGSVYTALAAKKERTAMQPAWFRYQWFITFLVAEMCKPYEIYRRMSDAYGETCLSKKKKKILQMS